MLKLDRFVKGVWEIGILSSIIGKEIWEDVDLFWNAEVPLKLIKFLLSICITFFVPLLVVTLSYIGWVVSSLCCIYFLTLLLIYFNALSILAELDEDDDSFWKDYVLDIGLYL